MKVAILGYGQFGSFMSKHLTPYAEVLVYARSVVDVPHGVRQVALDEACGADVVIFSVPMSSFEDVCKEVQGKIPPTTIIADVTSIKSRPLQLLSTYFPQHQILGTHPIFGPQSGKDGIEGLPIVLVQHTLNENIYTKIRTFFQTTLKLSVIEVTAEEHDVAMSHVQGLTHFIGRALSEMHISDTTLATQSYKQLLELVRLVGSDSWELFKTIENENPHASAVRGEFLKTLNNLNDRLAEK